MFIKEWQKNLTHDVLRHIEAHKDESNLDCLGDALMNIEKKLNEEIEVWLSHLEKQSEKLWKKEKLADIPKLKSRIDDLERHDLTQFPSKSDLEKLKS